MAPPPLSPRPLAPRTPPLPDPHLVAPLDNPRADRVLAVAHLATAAGRRRSGQFLVEGPHAVTELLLAADRAGRWHVSAMYATAAAVARHPEVVAAAADGTRLVEVSDRVMAAMSSAAAPSGVLAIARIPEPQPLQLPAVGFGALLVSVRDPGNVGTVIRAADASGAAVVALSPGCADPFSPKVVRSTAGSLFHLPVTRVADTHRAIAEARGRGWRILATAADGELSLDDLARGAGPAPTAPQLWLLGNEAHGLDVDVRAEADAVVRIPIRGHAESLNLAMAATLVLFASARLG